MYIIVSLAGCVAVHDLLYIPFFPFAAGDGSITREEAGMEGVGGSVTPEWPASVEVVGSVTEDGPGTEGVGGSVTPEWPASVEVVGSVTEDGPGTEGAEGS